MAVRLFTITCLAAVIGCGSEAAQQPADECPATHRLIGERCLAPGVQDDGCPAGTLGLDDGSCLPAGVPPELCAEGFVHDGEASCEPIVPASCPPGQMALLGQSECQPVMPCAAGPWGDIPVDASTVYVDASYPNADSDGSMAKPWTSIAQAVSSATAGALVAVAAGSYVEDVIVQTPVQLWGVCPDLVELSGSASSIAALDIRASGTQVRGLSITSQSIGIGVSGAVDVVVEQVQVHGTLGRGVSIENALGPTSASVGHSLIESCHSIGIAVVGAQATLSGNNVRGTLPKVDDQQYGWGVSVHLSLVTGSPSQAEVSNSVIELNHDRGVGVLGSEAVLHGLVVRGTQPNATDASAGFGITIQPSLETGVPASAQLSSSLVETNYGGGVAVAESQATLHGLVIRDTMPRADTQTGGIGIQALSQLTIPGLTTLQVTSSYVHHSYEAGVVVASAQATLAGLLVRSTAPRATDQHLGVGVMAQPHVGTVVPAQLWLAGSRLEDNHTAGVAVIGGEATLDGVLARGTKAQDDGLYGDGVVVTAAVDMGLEVAASATVQHSRFEQSARAGLANFGGSLAIGADAFVCNSLDLVGEAFQSIEYSFVDQGGNGCGCPEPSDACVAVSAGLAPPSGISGP